jgi:hypothetical protein
MDAVLRSHRDDPAPRAPTARSTFVRNASIASIACAAGLVVLAAALQGAKSGSGWRISTDLPGVSLKMEGTAQAAPALEGSFDSGVALSAADGGLRARLRPSSTFPMTLEQLREAFWSDPALGSVRSKDTYNAWFPLPGTGTLEIVPDLGTVELTSVDLAYHRQTVQLESRAVLHLRVPRFDAMADELLDRADKGALDGEFWKPYVDAPPAALTVLVRRATLRQPERAEAVSVAVHRPERRDEERAQRTRAALDRVVREVYGIGRLAPEEIERRALAELEESWPVLPARVNDPVAPSLDLAFVYGPARALALVASAECLTERIRGGDASAALSAGLGGHRAALDACRSLFESTVEPELVTSRARETDRRIRSACAAWAMIAIDDKQTAPEIEARLQGLPLHEPRFDLWFLLGFSGSTVVRDRLLDRAKTLGKEPEHEWQFALQGIAYGWTPDEYWLGW